MPREEWKTVSAVKLVCSFCGTPASKTSTLFIGDGNAMICAKCIASAQRYVEVLLLADTPRPRRKR